MGYSNIKNFQNLFKQPNVVRMSDSPQKIEDGYESFQIANNVKITANPQPQKLKDVNYYHVVASGSKLWALVSINSKGDKAKFQIIETGSNGLPGNRVFEFNIADLKSQWANKKLKPSTVDVWTQAIKAMNDHSKKEWDAVIKDISLVIFDEYPLFNTHII